MPASIASSWLLYRISVQFSFGTQTFHCDSAAVSLKSWLWRWQYSFPSCISQLEFVGIRSHTEKYVRRYHGHRSIMTVDAVIGCRDSASATQFNPFQYWISKSYCWRSSVPAVLRTFFLISEANAKIGFEGKQIILRMPQTTARHSSSVAL